MKCEACGMFVKQGLIITTSEGSTQYFCCEGCRDTYECRRDEALRKLWNAAKQ